MFFYENLKFLRGKMSYKDLTNNSSDGFTQQELQ